MVKYANGRIPLSALKTVDGVPLLSAAATSFLMWQKIAALEGSKIGPARPLYGSGYRDIATQQTYYKAAHGDKAAAAKCGIDPNMKVTMASPGYSSHGWGDRLDVAFPHSGPPSNSDLELAARYGWDREFGSADEYHFQWDGKTHTATSADKNRIVCHWLNGKELSVHSTTDKDGVWPVKSNFSRMLQEQGHKDGLYPTPQFKIDGIAGPRTEWLREHYFTLLFK